MATMVEEVGQLLRERGLTVAVAEACTAGLVGNLLCSLPGSSSYFFGGVIVYSGGSKTKVLGVPEELLHREGSVSRAVAVEMARRAMELLDTDIALSTTGVTGPSGGTKEKPVGLFYVGLVTRKGYDTCKELRWSGDRTANKEHTAYAALELLKEYLLQRV